MNGETESEALEWKAGLCGVCPAGCFVEVGLREGRLLDIRADTGHPLGMICRRGQHAPEIVYSKDRLKTPLRRNGPKGSHSFEPISWEQAYAEIRERLLAIKAESGPEAVSIYTGRGAFELSLCDLFQPAGVAVSSASSVLFPFGSPNTMGVGALCYVSFAMIAPHVTLGRMLIDLFTDIENAQLLVVWGTNPATDSPPLDMQRLEAAAARGAEIIVIDPRRTETAKRTGAEWIPIRPGSDGALALGLLQVMIDEELYDEAFATDWCHGFEELASYVQHFHPEAVEAITGVPAETVRRLARRLCAAGGACPVMYTGLEYSDSGLQAIRAVFTAFALAGQLDRPGGLCLAMKGSHFPLNREGLQANPDLARAVAFDRYPLYSRYRGEGHASGLVDAVLHEDPYKVRALIVHGASISTSWPQSAVWRETLSKLDFLVCIDRQPSADMAYADLVLPATTMFEIESYMVYGPLFRIRERLIEPVGEARNDYRIMAELAACLGYKELYPQSEAALLAKVLKGSGYSPEEIRAQGGLVQTPTPVMEYRKWEKGLLRPDGQPGFDTPTGRFEIASTLLQDYGYEPLPKYTEVKEGPLAAPQLLADYPLVFNSGARPQTDFRSQHHGVAGLVRDTPAPTVELNPADAAPRGIASGDLVEAKSPRGQVQLRAVVSEDIVAGAVEISMGGGGPIGPKAWQTGNVNELTDLEARDPISGFPVYKALLCELTLVEAAAPAERGPRSAGAAGQANTARAPSPPSGAALKKPAPQRLYLDNNATTSTAPSVVRAMIPYLESEHGNPSSLHVAGRRAHEAIETARRQLAQLLQTRPRRLTFTGGGSEADNLALKGVAFQHPSGHLITSAIEHPAVLKTCAFLQRLGYALTILPVDHEGLVSPQQLQAALREDTRLVSIMFANNEVGSLQPIQELAAIAHQGGALFHTDAVQAVGKIPVYPEALGVDLLSLSAHKLHGPKGVGALYRLRGVVLEPLIHGGDQEQGLRAGTENVAAIVGLGAAALRAAKTLPQAARLAPLCDQLEAGIQALLPGAKRNGPASGRLPGTLNMSLPGVRGESLVIAMDQQGISLSSGSACKSGSPAPTHVLMAMGRSAEEAHCAIRLSLADDTTGQDVERCLQTFGQVLTQMKSTVRFLSCK